MAIGAASAWWRPVRRGLFAGRLYGAGTIVLPDLSFANIENVSAANDDDVGAAILQRNSGASNDIARQ
jgi:hypothetical protein